jgi:hypothetical protein
VQVLSSDTELSEVPRLSLYAPESFSDECWDMAVPPFGRCGGGRLCRPLVASIATLLMTLFIQRSEHRDTQAIHAKLDELLGAQGEGKNHLATLDDKEPEQIEAFRKQVRAKR